MPCRARLAAFTTQLYLHTLHTYLPVLTHHILRQHTFTGLCLHIFCIRTFPRTQLVKPRCYLDMMTYGAARLPYYLHAQYSRDSSTVLVLVLIRTYGRGTVPAPRYLAHLTGCVFVYGSWFKPHASRLRYTFCHTPHPFIQIAHFISHTPAFAYPTLPHRACHHT